MCGIKDTHFAVEEPVATRPPPIAPVPPTAPSVPDPVIVTEEVIVAEVPMIEEVIPPSFHALAHAEIRMEPYSWTIAILLLIASILLAPFLSSSQQPKRDEL